jgi:cell division initiation protein
MSQFSGEAPVSGLARSFRGYDPAAVDRMVRDLTARCESAERERDELNVRLKQVEGDAAESRDLERTLRNTLVIAQRSADELKEQSRLEADATLEEARNEARGIVGQAETTLDGARTEARAIVGESERRADLLRAEIKLLEERERETRKRFSELLRSTLAQLEGTSEAGPAGSTLVEDLRPSAGRVEEPSEDLGRIS